MARRDKAKEVNANPDLHLLYRIERDESEFDALLLGKTLTSLSLVLSESVRASDTNSEGASVVVRPFKEGSFILDIVMRLKEAEGYLFTLAQSDAVKHLKAALELLGMVKSAKEKTTSLIDLIRGLEGKNPKQIKKRKEGFEFTSQTGDIIQVSDGVNNLYHNSVIHQHFYGAVAAPLEAPEAKSIETYLPGEKTSSLKKVRKEDLPTLREFSQPTPQSVRERRYVNNSSVVLKPKSGNYGEHDGLWTFTVAGTRRALKANIADEDFLKQYTSGLVRFYQGDTLDVELNEVQVVRGDESTVSNTITKVVEYIPGKGNPSPARKVKPSNRKRRSK